MNDRFGTPLDDRELLLLETGRRVRAVVAVAEMHEVRSSGRCLCGVNLNGHRMGIYAYAMHLAEVMREDQPAAFAALSAAQREQAS